MHKVEGHPRATIPWSPVLHQERDSLGHVFHGHRRERATELFGGQIDREDRQCAQERAVSRGWWEMAEAA
jgi:hypothetical protein